MFIGIGTPIPEIANLPGSSRPGGGGGSAFKYTAIDNSFSMEFDGTAYYTAGNPVGLQMTGSFSITGWLKCTGSTYKRVVSKDDGTNRSYYVQVQNTGEIAAGVFTGGTNQANTSSVIVNDGNWHFFALVFEQGTGTKIYVDNNSPSEDLFGGSIDNDPADFEIGRKGNNTNNFIGHIDEVAVWKDVILSEETIQAIYDTTANNPGKVADLSETPEGQPTAWYRMGD